MTPRKLSLKRESLQELSPAELTGVAGAAPTVKYICDTAYSCMTYVSCRQLECLPTVNPACW